MKKALSLIALLVAALVALTACGSNSDDSGGSGASSSDVAESGNSQSSAQHNDADVTFAQDMVPHHQQAVQMAKMAKKQANSAEVRDLAAKIEAAQGPQIQQMKGWLEDWGAEPAMGSMGHGGNGGMGHGSVSGMMTAHDMEMLSKASGAKFDQLFLKMMIKHHQGAVQMARTEVSKGTNPDAIAMSKQIISSQEAEIDQMRRMLVG